MKNRGIAAELGCSDRQVRPLVEIRLNELYLFQNWEIMKDLIMIYDVDHGSQSISRRDMYINYLFIFFLTSPFG